VLAALVNFKTNEEMYFLNPLVIPAITELQSAEASVPEVGTEIITL
jgi:hypothetical protein